MIAAKGESVHPPPASSDPSTAPPLATDSVTNAPSPDQAPAASPRTTALHALFLGATAALGPSTLLEPRISVFALLLLIIGLAASSRYQGRARNLLRGTLLVSVVFALVGMGRFVLREALPGIVEASGRAAGGRAVSRLREILFAQDASRRLALIDPDGNGVGGAGRLGELTGTSIVRPGANGGSRPAALAHPPLGVHFQPRVTTPQGPAAEEGGYLYLVCVPGTDGELSAQADAPVDEAAAERRFVAYAWPADVVHDHHPAFFIDEHERILETSNVDPADPSKPRLLGGQRAPKCSDALEQPTRDEWSPWRGKQPRKTLPGLKG